MHLAMHLFSRKEFACLNDKSSSCATAECCKNLVKGRLCKTEATWLGLSQRHRSWRCLHAECCDLGRTSGPGSCFAEMLLVISRPSEVTAKSDAPEGCQYAWLVLSQHILNLLPCYCCPLAKGPILAHILHPVIERAPVSNKRGA